MNITDLPLIHDTWVRNCNNQRVVILSLSSFKGEDTTVTIRFGKGSYHTFKLTHFMAHYHKRV